MGDAPDIHELARQVAVLEERMKTMQAEYERGLERIAGENRAALERNNAAFERLRADMARHREDAAKRETRLIVAIVATVIGGGGLAVGFLALLIGLPG